MMMPWRPNIQTKAAIQRSAKVDASGYMNATGKLGQ